MDRTTISILFCGVLVYASLSTGATLRVGLGRTYTSLQQVTSRLNAGDSVLVDGDQTYTGGVTFTRAGGDGTGWTCGRYRFVNNTIVAGSGAVFRCFDTLESVEMHNNVFYRAGGAANLIRNVAGEAAWTTGSPVIAGSNNWVVTGSQNVPSQWTGTVTGTDPGFADFANADLRPAGTMSALYNAGNATPAGPAGYLFTTPLTLPLGMPPLHTAVTQAITRTSVQAIDIGAYEFGSAGVGWRQKPAAGIIHDLKAVGQAFDLAGRSLPQRIAASHGVHVMRAQRSGTIFRVTAGAR